ncbi:methylmalonyl-CoA epimerase [Pontibacillus litoralis]|uniref:Methylmalonyl-CoA epimerase n=1 Tax=Pontibacillus litoralis JSM 072002 TaxID=1385512 RepID=A0A0A5G6Q2_9BACI|nr:methylmalonyl-CoA epimerase [Pontibacillus litoralis]KGX86848.1 methylmalonyl-CoA epimerase [Pontibacillus litoralis JSM 072002]
MEHKQIRVLIAKPGLDGHDRGALVIAQALRDHGMEVIYTGLRQSPQQIVQAAIQEDVDVIGLSSLSGAHNSLFPKVIEELKKHNAEDIPVIGGGVIPYEDIPPLEKQGIHKIFTPGTPTEETALYIKRILQPEQTSSLTPPEKLAHIGIAVNSIEQALPFYTNALGLRLTGVEEVASEQVKVAFVEIGETQIELLEPTDDNSPIAKFMEKRGEGIHHIAVEVTDIEERLRHYKEKGISLIHDTPKLGAHQSQVAFLHPKATNGVLMELCQLEKEEE